MDKKKSDLLGIRIASKRLRLSTNRMRGKMAEDIFRLDQSLQGNDVRKIHKGGDFVVQNKDLFGRKIGKPVTCEIKTGNAKLSTAQKKKEKPTKG